jgi:uncharacterized protein (TIGR03118 family)
MAVPSSSGPIWVSDNGTGVSTLYKLDGTAAPSPAHPLVVTIPANAAGDTGTPTGIVFNSTAFFKITKNGNSQPAKFIFVSEDGVVAGWNPSVDPTNAIAVLKLNGPVFKGLTMGVEWPQFSFRGKLP